MIEYKIAVVIWLIACVLWFLSGYALGEKRGRKKGIEMATTVLNEAKAADEAFIEKENSYDSRES